MHLVDRRAGFMGSSATSGDYPYCRRARALNCPP
jgi:hypothetical protein